MSVGGPDTIYLGHVIKDHLVRNGWDNEFKVTATLRALKEAGEDIAHPSYRFQAQMDSVDWIWRKILEAMKSDGDELRWQEIATDQEIPEDLVEGICLALKEDGDDEDDNMNYACAKDVAYAFVEYGWMPVFPESKNENKM